MRGIKLMLFGIAVMMLGWEASYSSFGEKIMIIGFFIVALGGVIDQILNRFLK